MSLVNLRYRTGGLFWDGRRERLEEMVLDPIQDPIEMNLDLGPSSCARS
jgi:cytochrome c peroxidase